MYAALSPDMSSLVEEYRKGAVSILDVWGQLSNELKHLTKEQGDLLAEYAESAEGQTLEQELGEELGEIYDSMTGVYDTAGTYRKNYFIALMNNFDAVEEALETISDVEGYSQKENLQYMDTYTAKVNTLKAEWEKLANDEQGWLEFKKGLVETATVLLQILDLFGGLRTGALALLSVVTLLFGKKIFMQIKESVADLKNMLNVVKNLTTATKTQTAATEADTAAKEANAAATEAAAAAANVYLAIIIAAIAAISAIVGLVDKFKQEQEKLRGETINLWKEHQQAATTLVQLNNALEQAEKNTSAYADAESNLAKQLGITKGKINENTAAYDDYIDKIKEASREKYKEYAIEASASAGAQKKQAENQETYFFKAADMTTEDQTALQALGLGYGYANALQQYTGVGSYAVGGNAFSQYSKVSKMVDYLYEKGATNTEFYGELVNLKKSLKAQIEDYLQAAAEADIFKMLSEGTSIAAAEPEAIHLLNSLGVKDYSWKDYVADIYRQYMTSATSSTSGAGGINDEEPPELMSEEERNKQILSLLKDIRNAADTIADIEEKRKALEDAERNLTARVYNADTGRFEPRANNKNVESAKDALNNALEKAAEKEIYDKISSGNFAFGELYAIVAKYRKMGVEKNPAWASSLYSQLETVENQAYNDAYYDDYWARWEEHVKSTPTGGGVGGSVVVPESVGGDYTDNSVSVGGIVVERSPREIAELKELLGIAATISEN